MTYRSYEARIKRIAVLTKTLRRYAKLIAAILLASIALVVGYLFARGLIIGGVTCNPVLNYGETLSPDSFVVLGTPTYEYAPYDTEEWTTVPPVMPGKYQVRVASERSFGIISHSRPTVFTIEKLNVTVTVLERELEYGNSPTADALLLPGDVIDSVGFVYDGLKIDSAVIHIPTESVRIVNAKGDDVTAGYNITTEDKTVNIVRRNITIAVEDVQKIYDGTPLTSEKWTLTQGELLEGDVLTLEFVHSITEVGSADNSPYVTVTNADGETVNGWYNITVQAGTLRVTPYPLTLVTTDEERMYNGKPLSGGFLADVQSLLPEGHTLTAEKFASITEVGETANVCETYKIIDKEGKDVTACFEVTGNWGTLKVTSRPIIICTADDSKVYDGTALSHRQARLKSNQTYMLIDGHYVDFSEGSITSITNVGVCDNEISVCILDSNGKDCTGNYELSYEYGKLEITALPVVITTKDQQWVYDGQPHSYGECDDSNLLAGHRFEVLTSASVVDYSRDGYLNTVETYRILDSAGEDVTQNYTVTIEPGRLQIIRRPLHIQTPSANLVYNGLPQSKTDDYTMLDGTSLAEGDYILVEESSTLTGVGNIGNVFVRYTIRSADGRDVTDNYDEEQTPGLLRVSPRPVGVSTQSMEKIYDGTPLACLDLIADDLVEGHTIALRDGGAYQQITNVGNAANEMAVSDIVILDSEGADVTSNYVPRITNVGTLTVIRRLVTVHSGSASKVYDGTDLFCTDYQLENAVEGHTLRVLSSTRIRNVGTVENFFAPDCMMLDAGGNDVTNNYNISYEYGTLIVSRRAVSIRMGDETREYDDTVWGHTSFTVISETGLVTGHMFVITDSSTIRNVGTLENELLGYRIIDSNGEDQTGNYSVSYESGRLTVTARSLHITTPDADQLYNGQPLSCRDGYIQTGLVTGHSIEVTNSTELVRAGYVRNAFEIRICGHDGADVTENYTISYFYGYLEVRAISLTVKTNTSRYEYNGQPISDTSHSPISSLLPNGHYAEVNPESVASLTNVGSVPRTLTLRIRNEVGDDVTDCFNIQYIYGDLIVERRVIAVTSDNGWEPFIYDGTPQTYSSGQCIHNTLVDGHRLVLTTEGSLTFPYETAVNRLLGAAVMDADGNDVTFNYAITMVDGTLYMNARPIAIKPQDATKEYDGLPLTCDIPEVVVNYGGLPLVDGHYAVINTSGVIIDIGETENWIESFAIYDSYGLDVTNYYSVSIYSGYLNVTPRRVGIQTMSDSKIYDGEELFCTEYAILTGSLSPNHSMYVFSYGEIVDVGTMDNYLEFMILDENGVEVSSNYYIVCDEVGVLEVLPRTISVATPDASKVFDSFPLEAPYLNVTAGSLAEGHSLDNSWGFASLTEPGSIENTCTLVVRDAYGNDVTGNYNISVEWGILEVLSGGYLDESGDLTKDPLPDVETNEDNVIRILGSATGTVYLRFRSFGDYTGLGFSKDVNAYYVDGNMVHPQLWVSYLLAQAGYTEESLQIQLSSMQYLTPYYLMAGQLMGDDVQFKGTAYNYDLTYMAGTLNDVFYSSETLPEDLADDELFYRNHVYSNYLQVPDYLRQSLQEIIEANGWTGTSTQTIYNIANYVRNRVDYNEDFVSIPEDVQDIVLYFLTEMDGAICQHYAAAATMLYRAVGIPARYCIGYIANTVEDEWVEIGPEQAHAWVEIYLDGKGWIVVEVTNSFEAASRPTLEFKPYDIHVTYDGNAHGPVGNEFWETTGGLPAGYRVVDVVYTGTQIDAGLYKTKIRSLRILDAVGNDVTDMFEITYAEADLIIDARELIIRTGSLKTSFDGLTHKNTSWEIVGGSLAKGHTCTGEVNTTIRDVGRLQNLLSSFIIRDERGQEIVSGTAYYDENGFVVDNISGLYGNYIIRVEYGTLEITWN